MRYWNYIHMLGRVDDDIKVFTVETAVGEKEVCNVRVVQEDRRGNLIVYVMIGWGQVASAMRDNLFRGCFAIFSGKVITGKKGIDGIQVICNEFTVVEDAKLRGKYNTDSGSSRGSEGSKEMAQFGPYKLWSADLVQCPGCGTKVITGFSRTFVEHWQPGFNQYFDRAKQRGSLYFDYEKPQPTP